MGSFGAQTFEDIIDAVLKRSEDEWEDVDDVLAKPNKNGRISVDVSKLSNHDHSHLHLPQSYSTSGLTGNWGDNITTSDISYRNTITIGYIVENSYVDEENDLVKGILTQDEKGNLFIKVNGKKISIGRLGSIDSKKLDRDLFKTWILKDKMNG